MSVSSRAANRLRILVALALWLAGSAPGARAAFLSGVSGTVASADGAPVAGAVIALQGQHVELLARTNARGAFRFSHVSPGTYLVRASAPRFDPLADRTIEVLEGRDSVLALSLVRSSTSLAVIGKVRVAGGDALSTSSTPTSYLDPQEYAAEGYTRLSDVLQNSISTTLVHPLDGGSSALPTSVALRGPDPTETLTDIDGHQVNNGNTGDFDLTLLDPADYASIELVKGISPSSLVGPDTIDGAINIRTLEPTTDPHGLARFTIGSFGSYGETLDTTGSEGRLGYALSLHRTTTSGEVNQTVDDMSGSSPVDAHVGSAVDGSTALAKLRYSFGSGSGFAEFSFHDQSAQRDLSAALTSYVDAPGEDTSPPTVDGAEGTSLDTHNAGYGLDVSVPLGGPDESGVAQTTALYRHYTSLVDESVFGPGADTSPYLFNNRDLVGDDSLAIDHHFYNSDLTFQYEIRGEHLTTDFIPGVVNEESVARFNYGSQSVAPAVLFPLAAATAAPVPSNPESSLPLAQTQRSAVLRYAIDPSAHLHFTAAGYYSDYSIFGSSFDPRFGVVYTPDARTVFRGSIGSTYQAPQLPELYSPPTLPNAIGGVINIGNPNLKPDRATEYGIGFDHLFQTGTNRTDLSVDLYRVNLRTPASALAPNPGIDAAGGTCDPITATATAQTICPLSYSVNAGDGRYQGIEMQGSRRIAPFTTVNLGYAVRSAYLTAVPPYIQDGTLVLGEQDQGLPLQKAAVSISSDPPLGFRFGGGFIYEGLYNELNQPQYATFDAHIGYRWKQFELEVSGTNLTNVYDQHFTAQGLGQPYGIIGGPSPSDSLALQGTAISASITRRF